MRERNGKQNAPRAIGRSNWGSVVRSVSRFSRARVRTASVPAHPHVQTSPRQGGGVTPIPAVKLGAWRDFWCCSCPQGVTSCELTVPSKGCRPQKKIHSDTLLCSIFATTPPFGQNIFFVQKWAAWGQLARCQRSYPRNYENGGHAPPPPGGGRSVHTVAPVPTLSARARARNAKQNAPRAIGRSNWRSVVRFVHRCLLYTSPSPRD